MQVLSTENRGIVNTIVGIANRTIKTLESTSKDFNADYIINNNKLAFTILNTLYKNKQLNLSREKNLQEAPTIIVPTMNSVLSMLEYNQLTDSMLKLNMSVASSTTIDAISKKLTNEVSTFKYNTLKRVKRYGYKVDAYIKGSASEISLHDMFKLKIIKVSSMYDMMLDKQLFNLAITNERASYEFDLSSLSLNGELSDIELSIFREDELKHLPDADYINSNFYRFTGLTNNIALDGFINSLRLEDINSLIFIILMLNELYIANPTESLGIVKNRLVTSLSFLYKKYTDTIKSRNLVVSYTKEDDDNYTIKVVDELYKEYTQNGGDFKALTGFVIKHVYTSNINQIGAEIHTIGLFNNILADKDSLMKASKAFLDTRILESKNKEHSNMVNYYIFALSVVTDDKNDFRKEVEAFVKTLSLGELIDTADTSLKIFRKVIMKGTNFDVFMEGFDEAGMILKDTDVKTMATYAAYKLILKYFFVQTTLTNKVK